MEGTILSVIDSFADAFDVAARDAHADPRSVFAAALTYAQAALARTPQQMALLHKAGVVDAGAKGFVDLLEGIAEFADGGPRAVRVHAGLTVMNHAGDEDPVEVVHAVHGEVDPLRRWCTECLLLGEAVDRDALRMALLALGADSLVLAGGGTRLRVHAHVDAPQALFDACARFGDVEGMKADDMRMQARSLGADAARVAIVTDSAPDDGRRTLDALRLRLDLAEAYLVETGPAIGAHAGRGTLVVSLQPAPV